MQSEGRAFDSLCRSVPTVLYDDIESRLAPELPDVQYVDMVGIWQRISPYSVDDEHI